MTGEANTATSRSVSTDSYSRSASSWRRSGSLASAHGATSTRYRLASRTNSSRAATAAVRSNASIDVSKRFARSPAASRSRPGSPRGSGTTPSKDDSTIARTRLARLPRPFASSELYRASIDSHEKFPSCPNWTSRRK